MDKTDELIAAEVRHIKDYCARQHGCRWCQFGLKNTGHRVDYKCMIGIPCAWEFSKEADDDGKAQ